MIRKLFYTICAAFLIGASGISCSEEISDCPNKLCVMSGGWKLVEVQIDGENSTEDFSNYQLILTNPTPTTEVSSQFQRVNISGSADSGTWSVENTNPDAQSSFKGSVLRLRPSDNNELREDWEIESFTPRQMILVMNRDITAKDGPATIRFVLVPF
jgi:hypothetical protein